MDKKELGQFGENIAAKFLRKNRYKILHKNWQNKLGEIDIVAEKNETIIFCEVKTILGNPGFLPEDEIGPEKQRQLVKMSQIYLLNNKLHEETACQIDIIAITIDRGPHHATGKAKIRHLKNALEDTY